MQHPAPIRPLEHASFRADKMGKSTLFESPRLAVGLNCFEPGQEHALHAHRGMDKV
jgi:quercetin dioxygenase-like cupin family protein